MDHREQMVLREPVSSLGPFDPVDRPTPALGGYGRRRSREGVSPTTGVCSELPARGSRRKGLSSGDSFYPVVRINQGEPKRNLKREF